MESTIPCPGLLRVQLVHHSLYRDQEQKDCAIRYQDTENRYVTRITVCVVQDCLITRGKYEVHELALRHVENQAVTKLDLRGNGSELRMP